MIGWAQLRQIARPIPAAPDTDAIAAKLGDRRLRLGDVGRSADWPSAPVLAAAFNDAAMRYQGDELALLADAVDQPARAYVLRASGDESRYALLGSWEGPKLAWVEVTITDTGGQQHVRLALTPLPPDAPGLADELFALYRRIDPARRPGRDPGRGRRDRALWVGGSLGEALDSDWEHHLAALLASRGLDVDVETRPMDAQVQQFIKRVEKFNGRVVMSWVPYAGGQDRDGRLDQLIGRAPLRVYDDDWETALIEAAVLLDERDQDRAEEVDGAGAARPTSTTSTLTGGPHYFKKTGPGGGNYGDRMELRDGPCTHNNFARARRPDQAKMGITRVAGVTPIKLEHCDSCTGGGFWRAHFP